MTDNQILELLIEISTDIAIMGLEKHPIYEKIQNLIEEFESASV